MSTIIGKMVGITLEVAKTEEGRKLIASTVTQLVGLAGLCPHPWGSLWWVSGDVAICGRCWKTLRRK